MRAAVDRRAAEWRAVLPAPASAYFEPGVAALIGAGVASAVALSSQFVYDGLASRRGRKAQRRERLHAAITEAGSLSARQHGARRPPRTSWQRSSWQRSSQAPSATRSAQRWRFAPKVLDQHGTIQARMSGSHQRCAQRRRAGRACVHRLILPERTASAQRPARIRRRSTPSRPPRASPVPRGSRCHRARCRRDRSGRRARR